MRGELMMVEIDIMAESKNSKTGEEVNTLSIMSRDNFYGIR